MAYYSEGGYCAEDMNRPYGHNPDGYRHGEGGERYAVHKDEYEEIDEVARAGRGHHHGHEHLGDHREHGYGGHREHGYGGHREHGYGGHREHGYGGHGGRRYDACESRRYDSCTGEY